MFGWNERAWRDDLPDTCGFENRPLVCPHRAIEGRGKTCLYWVKCEMVILISIFALFIEIISKSGFLTYSLYFLLKWN